MTGGKPDFEKKETLAQHGIIWREKSDLTDGNSATVAIIKLDVNLVLACDILVAWMTKTDDVNGIFQNI